MKVKYTGLRGMHDIFEIEASKWLALEEQLRLWVTSFGFKHIRLPILETQQLFLHSIGEVTDIVQKEMYHFTDKLSNIDIALRPEGTAGVVRAVVEHSLAAREVQKLWYLGPMFRHERPQKGRYRQFYQFGVEVIGNTNMSADLEIIMMQKVLWQRLGINNLCLKVNCLGTFADRTKYQQHLEQYFAKYIDTFDDALRQRALKNPLRILDSKDSSLSKIITSSPTLSSFLSPNTKASYELFLEQLVELGIEFVHDDRLVRGLDYYNGIVFEWVTNDLGAQDAVSAGGRYDALLSKFTTNINGACGFAIGLERLLLLMHNNCVNDRTDILIVITDFIFSAYGIKVANLLRSSGFNVLQSVKDVSLKAHLRYANTINARAVCIIGKNEVTEFKVMVKCMSTSVQELVSIDCIVSYLEGMLIDD